MTHNTQTMKASKHIITLALLLLSTAMSAQIGYQVSLLNTATGEPRANVTVSAEVTITDSEGNTIHTGTQQATTNDFGVLSLTVGDAATFANADTGKMPFFIAVSVDGTLIGKSQILSVPVAEVAGRIKSPFTKEELVGTWRCTNPNPEPYYWVVKSYEIIINPDGTLSTSTYYVDEASNYTLNFRYEIKGDMIFAYSTEGFDGEGLLILTLKDGVLYSNGNWTCKSFIKQ